MCVSGKDGRQCSYYDATPRWRQRHSQPSLRATLDHWRAPIPRGNHHHLLTTNNQLFFGIYDPWYGEAINLVAIQPIYGVNDSSERDCLICLGQPRNAILLPCRWVEGFLSSFDQTLLCLCKLFASSFLR